MADYFGYIDRFSIMGNCLVVDGWANECNPEVFYRGEKLEAIWKSVDRPDLIVPFGIGSEAWGFTLCALLPASNIEHNLFSIRFSAGMFMDNPCATFAAYSDLAFHEMRDGFKELVNGNGGRMLEIGSRDRSGSSYRAWFPGVDEWVGLDVTDGPGVDVVGDAHHLSRHVPGTFDFAFSMAVFEHLLMPWKVAIELSRVLKTGGRALIVSHAGWPLHEEPWDFFRFSRESWGGIFNAHTGFRIVDAQYQYPARITPDYVASYDMSIMSQGFSYLISGCVVEKVGDAKVEWNEEVSDIYNLEYNHA